MRVHSLTILHYGKDYLSYALRSVYHQVEQCHIFYTPTPSHGHATSTPPIETREELLQAAYQYDPDDKVKWYDMHNIINEGSQRDLALEYVKRAGAELVLVVDCDEIWDKTVLKSMLNEVWTNGKKRINLVNMVHFWRSFNWACYDEGWPQRILDLRYPPQKEYGDWNFLSETEFGRVYHFGYAVTSRIMHYKWEIHGHKNELRPNWLTEIWPYWPPVYPDTDGTIRYPGDKPFCCHPTNENNFWEPEPFDKRRLPDFMRDHHFWGVDKIE